jgi:HK97 family phage portal protein
MKRKKRSGKKYVKNSVPVTQITRNSSSWGDFVEGLGKLPAPTETTALTVSAIYACVNLIAGAIASLPINMYRYDVSNGERDRIFHDDMLWMFNEEMNTRWSAASGWEFMVQSLLLHGDCYGRIIRNAVGRPVALDPIHPYRVNTGIYPDGSRLVYTVEPEAIAGRQIGTQRVVDQDDMLHVSIGFNGWRGMSMLRYGLRTVGAKTLAMQDFSANFFANSARPDYVLQTDSTISPQKVEELKAQIDERHGSTGNAHRPMVLQGGLKVQTLTMNMEDLQLVELQRFQIEEIARIFGVPPFMIGHTEKQSSWGTGIETMGTLFVRFALRRHLNQFETEINRKFFRIATRKAEFDTAELERADTKSLYESLRIAVGRAGEPKLMSVNEARGILRLKSVEGGDDMKPDMPVDNSAPAQEPDPAQQ